MFKTKINKFKVIQNKLYGQKGRKTPKNTKKTCVFFWRGRSHDMKILNLIYHQFTIYCRSNKKKLGPYLLINYFKIKILKQLIFSFQAFSLIFLRNAVTRPPKYPPATFCYAGSYQKKYDFDKIECLGVLKNHMAIAPKKFPRLKYQLVQKTLFSVQNVCFWAKFFP